MTTEEMIRELYTVILGVQGTDEGGMSGRSKGMVLAIKEVNDHLKELNGAVTRNTTWRKALCWVMGIVVTALTTTIVFVVA